MQPCKPASLLTEVCRTDHMEQQRAWLARQAALAAEIDAQQQHQSVVEETRLMQKLQVLVQTDAKWMYNVSHRSEEVEAKPESPGRDRRRGDRGTCQRMSAETTRTATAAGPVSSRRLLSGAHLVEAHRPGVALDRART